jgi:signal transduction histidine kinase/transcriptional regulator with GAF, ATPase, and Fis domain
LTFFLISVGLTGYYFNQKSNNRLLHIYEDDMLSLSYINNIRANFRANESDMYKLIFITDAAIQQETLFDISKRVSTVKADIANYETTYLDPYEAKTYPAVKKSFDEYFKIRDKIVQLAIGGNKKQALDYYFTNKSKLDRVNKGLNALAQYCAQDAENAYTTYAKNKKDLAVQNKLILFLILLSLFVSVPFSLFITLLITKPLSELVANSNEVAKGNLEIKSIKVRSSDEIGKLTGSFNLMTNNIRHFIEKEKELKRREQLLREIMTSSMSSLNIQDILKTIVIQTGPLFNADRCFLIEYDVKNKEYDVIKDYGVYLSSLNFKDLSGMRFTSEQMEPFTKILFNQKQKMPINNINELQLPSLTKKILFEDSGVKSALFVPIFHRNNPLGVIAIDYINNYKEFTQDDIDLLSDIANQSAVFIYQAGLYAKIQDTSERERLLRVVINHVLVSENIDEATLNISKEIGKIFDADRVNLRFFNPFQKTFTNISGEDRKNENIPSIKEKGSYKKEVNDYIVKKIFEEKENLIIDNINAPQYPEFLKQHFQELGVKSIILCPIFHKNTPLALVAIANTESFRSWEKEEIDLLTPIMQQISIGINLFNLNNKLSKSLEGEKIARKIITDIRKSEDHDIIYSYLLDQLINIFNADRAYHLHSDENYNFEVKNENVKDDKTESILNKLIPSEIGKMLMSNGFMTINDIEKDIKNAEFRDYLKNLNIQSLLMYPTTEEFSETSEERRYSALTIICSSTPREWSSEEIDTFKLIAGSASIVYLEIKQRKEVEAMRNTFIATLTHDLRSPIIAEQKTIEFMLNKGLDEPLRNYAEYIEEIHKTNEGLLGIVNNLLVVYHYESGRFELSIEPANLMNMIDENIRQLRSLAADRESEIITDVPENLPLVQIDKNEINRVFVNLISNAIKHNKKGSKIIISAKKLDHAVQVSISDNGEGIPESEIPTIFQKYPTTKRKVGTGLGLYLSKQIIDAHDCKIWFTTERGQGTTFSFTLPLYYPEVPRQ